MFSVDLVKKIHVEIIKTTGGSLRIRNENLLKSSLMTPFQTFSGEELYKTPEEKASKLLELIIKNHPFIDGNKRTAYVLFRLFLEINGLKLIAPEEEKYSFIMKIASGELEYEDILRWVKEHIKSVR